MRRRMVEYLLDYDLYGDAVARITATKLDKDRLAQNIFAGRVDNEQEKELQTAMLMCAYLVAEEARGDSKYPGISVSAAALFLPYNNEFSENLALVAEAADNLELSKKIRELTKRKSNG